MASCSFFELCLVRGEVRVLTPGLQVCVHLDDWEHLLKGLKGRKHPDEKALYQHLSRNVVPSIREEYEVRAAF